MDGKLCGAGIVWGKDASVPLSEFEILRVTWLWQHRALGRLIYCFYPNFPAAAGGALGTRSSPGIYPALTCELPLEQITFCLQYFPYATGPDFEVARSFQALFGAIPSSNC